MKKMVYIVAAAVVTSTMLMMPVCAEVSTDVLMWYLDLGDSKEEGIRTQTFDTLNFYLRSTEDPSRRRLRPSACPDWGRVRVPERRLALTAVSPVCTIRISLAPVTSTTRSMSS